MAPSERKLTHLKNSPMAWNTCVTSTARMTTPGRHAPFSTLRNILHASAAFSFPLPCTNAYALLSIDRPVSLFFNYFWLLLPHCCWRACWFCNGWVGAIMAYLMWSVGGVFTRWYHFVIGFGRLFLALIDGCSLTLTASTAFGSRLSLFHPLDIISACAVLISACLAVVALAWRACWWLCTLLCELVVHASFFQLSSSPQLLWWISHCSTRAICVCEKKDVS